MFYGNKIIESQSGIQQGDPLGPLLFSLALIPLITKINEDILDLIQNTWYLDDGVIADYEEDLAQALNILKQDGPELRFYLCMDKCQVRSPPRALNQID